MNVNGLKGSRGPLMFLPLLCLPLEAMIPMQTAKQADKIYTSATKENQHKTTIVLQVLRTHQSSDVQGRARLSCPGLGQAYDGWGFQICQA